MILCPKCKDNKEESFFYKNKSSKNGYSCYCKSCMGYLRQENYKKEMSDPVRYKKKLDRLKRYRETHEYTFKKKWDEQAKKASEKARLKRYGLTKEEHEKMLSSQSFGCAICGRIENKKLSIDHDHKTGKIR